LELAGQEDLAIPNHGDGALFGPALGVDIAELGGLAEAVEELGDFGSALGARADVILAAEDVAAQSLFGGVVVDWDLRIVEEADEPVPDAQRL
jgi:hypothetical protein